MLLQVSELRIPLVRAEAYYRYAALRTHDCAVSIIWSSGLATDWGLQSKLVDYIAGQRRSQLSILLRGHGYVAGPSGPQTLATGDVVELDQCRHDDEGYGGSPCELVVVDWDDGGRLGPAHRGPPRRSKLTRTETDKLRALVARVTTTPGDVWLDDLVAHLGALGLPAPRAADRRVEASRAVVALYRALGAARGAIHQHVSVDDLASDAGLSIRTLRRGFTVLASDFGMTTPSWRAFASDARMSRAQQLLSLGELPLKQVAALSGFRSQAALNHAFAARGTMTPRSAAKILAERWR